MRSLVVVALMWIGACASQPPIVTQPPPSSPRPALKRPAATLFGLVVDGAYKRQSRFELSEETVYGWRIKLPCTGPTEFRETLQLPAVGGWQVDPDFTRVSDDRRRAVTEDYSGCYDGWIQHAWRSGAEDPPGEYLVTVEVAGYAPQTFRVRFVRPENAEETHRSRP